MCLGKRTGRRREDKKRKNSPHETFGFIFDVVFSFPTALFVFFNAAHHAIQTAFHHHRQNAWNA